MSRRNYITCDCCEAEIENGEDYYEFDGERMCESCAEEYFRDHRYTLDIDGEIADYIYDCAHESTL